MNPQTPSMRRMDEAIRLGPLARFRLRDEVLLESTGLEPPLTNAEREELERITVNPRDEDEAYLGSFDERFPIGDEG